MKSKKIEGFEDYSVSVCGNIFNAEGRKIGSRNNRSYIQVVLYGRGKKLKMSAHRLVAQAFIPNPEEKPYINHINGIKSDNRVENLEWVTPKENSVHAQSLGLAYFSGEDNKNSLLSNAEVEDICKLLEKGCSVVNVSRILNKDYHLVHSIKYRKNWNSLSSKYTFKETNRQRVLEEEEVRDVCYLIKSGHSNLSISTLLNIPINQVRKIKKGKIFPNISKEFMPFCKTREHINESVAEKVCFLINDGLRNCDISTILDIHSKTVSRIRSGESWTQVGRKILKREESLPLSLDKLEKICQDLQNGAILSDITSKYKIKEEEVKKLINREKFTFVSKNFKF